MRLGILTIERDNVVNDLIDVCKKKDIDYHVINPKNIVTDLDNVYHYKLSLKHLDAIFVRNLGYDSFFRFDILKFLEEFCFVVNPYETINLASNKFLSSIMFKKLDIPHPETYVTENISEALKIIDYLEDAVIKPLFGSGGEGIIRLKKEHSITKKIKDLEEFQKKYTTFYIQKFVECKYDDYRDIRVFIVGDELYPIYRIGGDNWKNNISLGGRVEICELDIEMRKICYKVKKAFNLYYGGIDLLEGDKTYILEVNSTPSWKGASIIYNDIPEKVLNMIIEETKK
ncbi:RimK family alpha-L-glutamate ligase [Methanocaldococcus indicus]|uniref:RimK family alpha-L-glutamate ligase n=1 Tax=Methanocaldococcus indicus TaxID=213231 RepID=UPI003C6CCAC9